MEAKGLFSTTVHMIEQECMDPAANQNDGGSAVLRYGLYFLGIISPYKSCRKTSEQLSIDTDQVHPNMLMANTNSTVLVFCRSGLRNRKAILPCLGDTHN